MSSEMSPSPLQYNYFQTRTRLTNPVSYRVTVVRWKRKKIIDSGESTVGSLVDGDSSGINSIPSSNQRLPDVENSIGSSEANRVRVAKKSHEESILAPQSSRLLSLKVEIADGPATEEGMNPSSAVNSLELETEADAEVSKDTTIRQNKPDAVINKLN
ncbi:uncharacterized protein LOC134210090 [Armigeres subalbatus]|uniref:uncharacterized protein LOC134210090 n=1 Tax=Armigeres subalbatus TaxID=124917 RepID=UPI002ED35826